MGSDTSGEGREWRLPPLPNANGLILCGKSEEDLRVVTACLVEAREREGVRKGERIRVRGWEEVIVDGE